MNEREWDIDERQQEREKERDRREREVEKGDIDDIEREREREEESETNRDERDKEREWSITAADLWPEQRVGKVYTCTSLLNNIWTNYLSGVISICMMHCEYRYTLMEKY